MPATDLYRLTDSELRAQPRFVGMTVSERREALANIVIRRAELEQQAAAIQDELAFMGRVEQAHRAVLAAEGERSDER